MKYRIIKDNPYGLVIYCLCNLRGYKVNIAYLYLKGKQFVTPAGLISRVFGVWHYEQKCGCTFDYTNDDLTMWDGLIRLGGLVALYNHLNTKTI